MQKTDAPFSAETSPSASKAPSYVILTEDCDQWLAGRVFAGDMIAALDAVNAKYREATPRERGLAGFSD